MRPALRRHAALGCLLDAVVADRRRRVEGVDDVGLGELGQEPGLHRVARPHPGEAVRLQLEAHAVRGRPRGLQVETLHEPRDVLDVVAPLVSHHIELGEGSARRAAPGAWIVDFTNPVGIVTQALLDEGHRAIGLCNVAINIQRTIADRLGVPPERVELEQVGLNHLSWERAARVDGVDRLPELLERDGAWLADHVGLPLELVRALGAIPSYYLHYYYETARVISDQRDGHTRAQDVIDIEARLLDLYRDQGLAEKPALLADRGGAHYNEAAAQLIASLHDGAGDLQVVDMRNDGALPDLSDSAVVEIAARIDREGAHAVPLAPLAPEMRGLVQAVKAYEELTVDAARSGDRRTALRALIANPLVGEWAIAEPLLTALLDANRTHLPRFFAG